MKLKLQILVTTLLVGMVAWWASLQSSASDQGLTVQWFSSTYGLMALIGSLIGFSAAKKWGGFETIVGKALTLFSLGLLAQELGQIIYAYYIYIDEIQIPYPSVGDVAYLGSVLLYICAASFLAKAAGARFSLKDARYKAIAILVPTLLLAVSYWVLLNHHSYGSSKLLTIILDFGYPMGQALYISIAITAYLLSRKLLGGVMRSGILLIILALFLQYISDFIFIYQSSHRIYVSGRFDDLLYLISYYALVIALIKFHAIYDDLSSIKKVKDNIPSTGNKGRR